MMAMAHPLACRRERETNESEQQQRLMRQSGGLLPPDRLRLPALRELTSFRRVSGTYTCHQYQVLQQGVTFQDDGKPKLGP